VFWGIGTCHNFIIAWWLIARIMMVKSFVRTYQTVDAMRLQLYGILGLDAILSLQRIG
jgi:hypothetical protein